LFLSLFLLTLSLIIDALIVLGLIILLIKLRLPRRAAIWLASLAFGLTLGVVTACIWPSDSSAFLNPIGSFSGDWIYREAIRYLGNPFSPQAHYTIPWPLRVPQVYVLASIIGWGVVGAIGQLVFHKASRR
jgi:hypothetical protein